MGIYSRSSARARTKGRKRRARTPKPPPTKKQKKTAAKKTRSKPRAVVTKPKKKARKVAPPAKKRARAKKAHKRVATKAKASAKRTRKASKRAERTRTSPKPKRVLETRKKAAKPRKKSVKPRKAPVRKVRKKKPAPPKRKAAKPSKKPTKTEIAKENRRLRQELGRIRGAEGRTRKKTKKSRAKRAVKKDKRGLERSRIEQAFAIHEFPHATAEEALKSRKEDWARKRKRFAELLEKARRAGQLPAPERVRRRLDSHRSRGEQVVVRIRRRITPRNVEAILYKVEARIQERLSGRFPFWLAKVVLSTMGEKLVGSGARLLVVKERDQDAEVFYTQSYDSTGAWNSSVGMLHHLRGMLEEYAGYRRNIVYLHTVKFQNFERKP